MSALFFLFATALIRWVWHIRKPEGHWLYPVLMLALPFAAGGFHTGTGAVLSLVLTAALLERIHTRRSLVFFCNMGSLSLVLLFAAYCLTPLWASDKGMAPFALPRYLPAVLYLLFLMQGSREDGQQALRLLPVCGCLMTLASLLMLPFPGMAGFVTVNGRLGGFFQYPNSFAAFLLAGVILLNSEAEDKKWQSAMNFILVSGIVLSGSKTVFILLCALLVLLCLMKKQKKVLLTLGATLVSGLCVGLLADSLALLPQADRFTDIQASSGTFLVRLLYFRDVLPTIVTHPFGLGYGSYPAIQGTIQTGRYAVTYIHNGLLQLLLETGWIPAGLLAFSLLRTMLSRKTDLTRRLVLLALTAHCMLDFDLQFPVFWVLLLSCMDLHGGKRLSFRSFSVLSAGAACLLAVSLWLGCGDWLYRQGQTEACLTLTPFHTEALSRHTSGCGDAEELDRLADRILKQNPTHSLACSAKANAAFSRGDIRSMIQWKEDAIRFSPYTLEEYLDYFEKLYTAMELYRKAGDPDSAAVCRSRLLQIPDKMTAVMARTHPLAWKTGDDPTLALPEDYLQLLQALS